MIHWLFRCIACDQGLSFRSDFPFFPLCARCSDSLISCPELCNTCASVVCPSSSIAQKSDRTCTRPWVTRPAIHSYSAQYLLIDATYRVLRRWKTRRGPLFDRRVFKPDSRLIRIWNEFGAQAIVPIPQSFYRAWKMKGSRAEHIARSVGSQIGVPIVYALQTPEKSLQTKRQAELSIHERYQNEIKFRMEAHVHTLKRIRRIILVDDFMTTGHTLEKAALVLNASGVDQIHVHVLGIKPAHSLEKSLDRLV